MRYLVCSFLLAASAIAQIPSASSFSPLANQKQKVLWQKLDSAIHDIDQHLDGVMGVAVEDLNTGDQFFLHENEIFAQASSIKIAVLANLYLQGQQGKLKLTVVSEQGKEAVVTILERGSFLGEGCLAGQLVCMATATSLENSSIVRIAKQAMMDALHNQPTFSALLLTYLLPRNFRI